MKRDRSKTKGRRETGCFTLIPHAVQDSDNWKACRGNAIKLVCDLARQYNGRNNGDLCASISVLKSRGWKSSDTLRTAQLEARHYGLLLLTRQGGLNCASLYALTWQALDDCKGKHDYPATRVPPGNWKEPQPRFKAPKRKQAKNKKPSPESESDRTGIRGSHRSKAA
jgi:hypothetical protein